jgi:hypothetical protein
METYQHIIETLALTLGVGWASGINLYATLFVLGFMGANGYAALPPDLAILTNPLVMAAAGFMYCVEFFADKTPGMDTGWDAIHTFIRIPAGAILAAGAVGDVTPAAELAAAIVGGSLAAGAHMTKAGSRILINASPEPLSNWLASLGEDALVIVGVWGALRHPVLFLIALALFVIAIAWALPRVWRGVRALWRRLSRLFRRPEPAEVEPKRLPRTAARHGHQPNKPPS